MGSIVGGGDEQHVAEVKWDIKIVILKSLVLFRVQHFQQGTGRIAAVVPCQLVDLIQQDDRVGGLGGIDGTDDAAGHCADVCTAVAADLGFIMHAAKAHAGKVAVHAGGNGARNGGFADTRRADQADDLALDVRIELADGQNFQNALLDLFQTIVVMVQHLAGMGLVQIILGKGVPGQADDGIQIAANHADFGLIAGHFAKALTFFQQLFLAGGIQVQVLNLLGILFRFGTGILGIAQFFADDMHLFPQVVIALVFIHLDVHFIVQFFLNGQHFTFLAHHKQELFQPAGDGIFLQNGLLVLIFQQQVGRHIFAQVERIIRGDDVIHHILGDLRAVGKILLKALFQAANQRLGLGALIWCHTAHGSGADISLQVFATGIQVQQFSTGLSFYQYLDQIFGYTQHLLNFRNDAIGIQILGRGLLGLHILLCNQKNIAVGVHGSLDGGNGLLAAHLKVDHIIGEHHQPAQCNHRQVHGVMGHTNPYFCF